MRKRSFWFAVDVLLGLLIALTGLVKLASFTPHTPARINTYGAYAITITWPENRHDDIDLYVQNPDGGTAYYLNKDAGFLHLEHDDLGTLYTGYQGQANYERVVLRGVQPGEYTANVHVYSRTDADATIPVVAQLWELRGKDRMLRTQQLRMGDVGDEQTAFRFTLNAEGDVVDINRLPKTLVSP